MSDGYDFERVAFERMLEAGKLPRPNSDETARALRKVGIKLRGTGLLRDATLPEGWRAVQTESRHGQLIDPKDRVRALLFYKGGPVESSGWLEMSRRYTLELSEGAWYVQDNAMGVALSEPGKYELAEAWLNKHYPKSKNPLADWDDEGRPRRRFLRR